MEVFMTKKLSEEHKAKLSKALKGIKRSEETKNKIRGKNNPMYGVHRFGKDSPSWNGGSFKHAQGYIYVYQSKHPFCNKRHYVKRANIVMEKYLGRYLNPEEIVHHRNEIKDDDRIENLKLFDSNSAHRKYHCKKRKRNKSNQFIS